MKYAIPHELAQLPFWTRFNGKKPRWERRGLSEERGSECTGRTLADFSDRIKEFGIFTSLQNELVVVDIDHGKTIPETLPPTYSEISVSGNGVHLFYFTTASKEGAKAQYAIPPKFGVDGEIFVGKHAIRVTGVPHPDSLPEITRIDHLETFGIGFKAEILPPANDDSDATAFEVYSASEQDVSIPELSMLLAGISLSQTPRIQAAWRTLTGRDYSHYDFWLRIGMGIHSLYPTAAGFRVFDAWSRTDPVAYDATAVEEKWSSFSSGGLKPVSVSTIRALYNLARYAPEYRTAKGIDVTNIRNIEGFCDFYHFRMYANGSRIYVSGDEDLMCQLRYIEPSDAFDNLYGPLQGSQFDLLLTDVIQNVLYPRSGLTGPRLAACVRALRHFCFMSGAYEESLFLRWIRAAEPDPDASFERLKEGIRLDPQQDPELAWTLLHAALMTTVKMQTRFSGEYDMNGGMLIFVGPEQCGKSGFFNAMVPQDVRGDFMASWSTPLLGSKEYRDFQIALSGKPFLVIDEIDGIMGNEAQASSFLKDLTTKNTLEYTKIYESTSSVVPRRAMIFGSTNEQSLVMTKSGTRRMWIIRVRGFDWKIVNNFNWRGFYRNLLSEYEDAVGTGKMPWLIDSDTVAVLNRENEKLMAKNSQDIELGELFPIEIDPLYLLDVKNPQKCPFLLTLTEAQKLIRWRSEMTADVRSKAQLVRALTTVCREYVKPLYDLPGVPEWLDVTKGVVRCKSGRSYKTYYPIPISAEELKNGALDGIEGAMGK